MDTQARTPALDSLLELVLLLSEDMTRSLARDGLTTSRAHLLWELLQRGPTKQQVLAEALGVSARNVTGLVDALVASGFVTREPHPGDRRATLVSFTEHGSGIARAMRDGHEELARLLFGGMTTERYRCLLAGLDDVLAVLRERISLPEEVHA